MARPQYWSQYFGEEKYFSVVWSRITIPGSGCCTPWAVPSRKRSNHFKNNFFGSIIPLCFHWVSVSTTQIYTTVSNTVYFFLFIYDMFRPNKGRNVVDKQDRQCTYNVTLERGGVRIAVRKRCVCVRACESPSAWACACVCVRLALLIQHTRRIYRIVTSFVAPQAPKYSSTLCH